MIYHYDGERALPVLPGRGEQTEVLREALGASVPSVVPVVGPRGSGKTTLIRRTLLGWPGPVIHLDVAPDEEGALRRTLEEEARAVLGDLPAVERPELLPTGDPGVAWVRLLDSILEGFRRHGSGVLVLDGVEWLERARKRLPGEVGESWRRLAGGSGPIHLLLVARSASGLQGWPEPGEGEGGVELGGLPFRVAGWAHGPASPREAFRFWALFGDDPGALRGIRPGESLEEAAVRRILSPGGDLHDGPLLRLDRAFQAPQRYLALLRVLAGGDRAWGELAEGMGEEGGNRLAPYLNRLAEEGLLRIRRPLGSSPRSRDRRYGIADPFMAFWCGVVLPGRSALLRLGPEGFWERECAPPLQAHLDRWLPEAARRWLGEHADEGMGAPAREVGALWGAEEPELDVAGRLASGMVAYGIAQRGAGEAPGALLEALRRRVEATRYGIGREARASLLFLQGPPGEELRRGVARERMARVVPLEELMGPSPWTRPTPHG